MRSLPAVCQAYVSPHDATCSFVLDTMVPQVPETQALAPASDSDTQALAHPPDSDTQALAQWFDGSKAEAYDVDAPPVSFPEAIAPRCSDGEYDGEAAIS